MCPPGVDQTCRTAQKWHLLSPELGEKIQLPIGTWMDSFDMLRQYVDAVSGSDAFELLARPEVGSFPLDDMTRLQVDHQLAPIETLPAEMLSLVLNNKALNRRDVLSVGACSRTIWAHVFNHVSTDIRRSAGRWAGLPLLCTGTWLEELPPAIYKRYPEQQETETAWRAMLQAQRLQRVQFPPGSSRRVFARRNGMCPARHWNWYAVSEYEDRNSAVGAWTQAAALDLQGASIFVLRSLTNALRFPWQSTSGQWIMRNLDLKEFMRLSVVVSDGHGINATVEGAPHISIDRALLLLICWTTSSDLPLYSEGDRVEHEEILREGKWAGDALDIVRSTPVSLQGFRDTTTSLISFHKKMKLSEPRIDDKKRRLGIFSVNHSINEEDEEDEEESGDVTSIFEPCIKYDSSC